MIVYWFDLILAGPIDLEVASERLYAICSDVLLAGDESGGEIMFSREADSAAGAIQSAIEDAEAAGLAVLGVAQGRVAVEEIYENSVRREVIAWPGSGRSGGI